MCFNTLSCYKIFCSLDNKLCIYNDSEKISILEIRDASTGRKKAGWVERFILMLYLLWNW
jgi:hypothetical protein